MLNKFLNNKTLFFLIVLTLVGGLLRFWNNTKNPPELNIDEVSIGYNAYSILKTGKDEYGKFLPVAFESVGDYKPSGLIYLTVPSIYLFGLNEFSVRFPTALFSTLTIASLFFLTKEITKNNKIALFAALLLTFSPWHIYYSRYAIEATVSLFFLVVGIYFFLKLFRDSSYFNPIVAAVLLSYSMYTYHTQRVFIPVIVLIIFLTNFKNLKTNFKKLIVFGFCSVIICLPLGYSILFGSGAARAQMTFVGNDIEFTRPILAGIDSNKNLLLIFYIVRKYFNYFTSAFLFYSGLSMTPAGILGIGVLYIFDLPFLIAAIIGIYKNKIIGYKLPLAWIFLGIFPAALTQNEQHPLRTIVVLPALLIILSSGIFYVYKALNTNFRKFLFTLCFSLIFVFGIVQAFFVFNNYFPYYKSEAFMYGTKEAVTYALENKDKFNEIIFDPTRGVEGPYIVSVPHMYILFYSAYDPLTYQNIKKTKGNDLYGFDKFTIRKVNWSLDRGEKDKLFIGSPWSLPLKDIKEENILKKIYLKDGQLALLVVKSE